MNCHFENSLLLSVKYESGIFDNKNVDVCTYECVDVKVFFQNFHISCYSAIWNKETFIYTCALFFEVLTKFDKIDYCYMQNALGHTTWTLTVSWNQIAYVKMEFCVKIFLSSLSLFRVKNIILNLVSLPIIHLVLVVSESQGLHY